MNTNSLKDLFQYIRSTRNHVCNICGETIREPKTRCFAHILGHGMHKMYKFFSNNIILVCSIQCHRELDRRVSGSKYDIEQIIRAGDYIDISQYHGKSLHPKPTTGSSSSGVPRSRWYHTLL